MSVTNITTLINFITNYFVSAVYTPSQSDGNPLDSNSINLSNINFLKFDKELPSSGIFCKALLACFKSPNLNAFKYSATEDIFVFVSGSL